MSEIISYFNRFYHIVLKPLIDNPLAHSEWVYFTSMLNTNSLEKDRIELYLSILAKEHKQKTESRSFVTKTDSTISNQSKSNKYLDRNGLVDSLERQIPICEPKLDKVLSEKWKNNGQLYQKIGRDSFQLKRLPSDFDTNNSNSKLSNKNTQSELKPFKNKRDDKPYALQSTLSPNLTQYITTLGLNSKYNSKEVSVNRDNEKYQKLYEISSKIVSIFSQNSGLRG